MPTEIWHGGWGWGREAWVGGAEMRNWHRNIILEEGWVTPFPHNDPPTPPFQEMLLYRTLMWIRVLQKISRKKISTKRTEEGEKNVRVFRFGEGERGGEGEKSTEKCWVFGHLLHRIAILCWWLQHRISHYYISHKDVHTATVCSTELLRLSWGFVFLGGGGVVLNWVRNWALMKNVTNVE